MKQYKTDTLDLRLMDCMDLMRESPDKHFDLAIVDPPYGIGVDGKNIISNPNDIANANFQKKNHDWDDSMPDAAYFTELKRVSKEQIIWGGNYFCRKIERLGQVFSESMGNRLSSLKNPFQRGNCNGNPRNR